MAQRIEELRPRSEVTSSEDVDEEFVLSSLLEPYNKALARGKVSAANRALELLGKKLRLFQERNTRHGQHDPLDEMDDQQLVKFIRRTLMDLGPGSLKQLGLIAIEPVSSQRDEAVRFFREQLRAIDLEITVFDPQAGQVQPPEDGSAQGEALH